MRRFSPIRCGLTAAILTLSLVVGASAVNFGTGKVTASALRLRSMPSTTSATLAQVYRGAVVDVLTDAVDGWYQVSYNGLVGYMAADYLTVTPLAVAETPADSTGSANTDATEAADSVDSTESAETASVLTGVVTLSSTSSKLNVRASASTSGTKLGMLANGTVLTLEEAVGDWYRITYGGTDGYVSAQYIKLLDSSAADTAITPASATGAQIVAKALTYLGCSYRYGSAGPTTFDCSGFTYYIFSQFGYSINRTASTQFSNGVSVSYSELQAGDLVFFRNSSSSKTASHVGIYLGDGTFIHAENSRTGVVITSMSESWYANRYIGARRIG